MGYFKYKCQGHKVIDPGFILKGFIEYAYHYEVSISYSSKFTWPRLKFIDMFVKAKVNVSRSNVFVSMKRSYRK